MDRAICLYAPAESDDVRVRNDAVAYVHLELVARVAVAALRDDGEAPGTVKSGGGVRRNRRYGGGRNRYQERPDHVGKVTKA